jgi:hypothetical protein
MATMNTLYGRELTEEIEFFRDVCGYSDERIELRLGLADGTIAQRRRRAVKKATRQQLADAA